MHLDCLLTEGSLPLLVGELQPPCISLKHNTWVRRHQVPASVLCHHSVHDSAKQETYSRNNEIESS